MRRQLLATVSIASIATTAAAQTTTTTGTTTTGSTTSGTTNNGSANSGFTSPSLEAAPTITSGGASGANVNSSNAFAGYYANPFYQGRPGSTGYDNPGGFGTALSGSSSTGNRSSTGINSTRSTSGTNRTNSTGLSSTTGTSTSNLSSLTGSSTTGRTTTGTGANSITGTSPGTGFGSGFGNTGTTGNTGFGNTNRGNTGFGNTGFGNRGTSGFGNTNQQQAGVIVPQPTPIRFQVSVRFPTPPVVPAQMTTDLRGTLDRSTFLTNAAAVQVTSTTPGVVVLRGQVKDEEEARTAEGIVRLTPGVREVVNELQFPKQ
jgi:hypothetical protein